MIIFANGIRVTVNFSLNDYTMSDGFMLKSCISRIEGARSASGAEGGCASNSGV